METRENPCRFEEHETHCIIELRPELNKAPWGDIDSIGTSLVERMRAYADGKGKKSAAFLIDLTPLNYMGSATVALVVRLWKLVKEKNGKMVVVNADPTVLEVLRLSGLEDVWTIVDSHEEGYKSLGLVVRKPVETPEAATTATAGSAPPSYNHVVEAPRGAAGWVIVAIALLIASAVGLFFFVSGSSPVSDTRISLGLLFGGGVLGLIPATAAACLGIGLQRVAGIAGIIGCLALLAAGVVLHPDHDALLVRTKAVETPKPVVTSDKTPGPSPTPNETPKSKPAQNAEHKPDQKSDVPTNVVPPPKPESGRNAGEKKGVLPAPTVGPGGGAKGAATAPPPPALPK